MNEIDDGRASLQPERPPSHRVPSDNCVIVLGGVPYRPHVGEWVEFRGNGTVADMLLMQRLMRGSRELAALEALDTEPEQLLERLESHGEAILNLCARLARMIAGWNWTDPAGQPYPNPPSATDLTELEMDELRYLLLRGQVTDPNQAGAASMPSSAGSPAPQPNRASRRRRG